MPITTYILLSINTLIGLIDLLIIEFFYQIVTLLYPLIHHIFLPTLNIPIKECGKLVKVILNFLMAMN